jgi:hypothetical protein
VRVVFKQPTETLAVILGLTAQISLPHLSEQKAAVEGFLIQTDLRRVPEGILHLV